MDVLSEVLKVVRLEGALFFNAEFSAPWCPSSPRSTAMAPHVSPVAGRLITYNFLTEGRAYARALGWTTGRVDRRRNRNFPARRCPRVGQRLSRKTGGTPCARLRKNLTQGLRLARFGGGCEITRFV